MAIFTTHLFWAYGSLSRLETLSVRSFVAQGYAPTVWSYGDLPNAPAGCTVRDAREVLPESAVFKNKAGSYASFADLFRYELLQRFGGLWSDTDVIAVAPASSLPDVPFLVTERWRDGSPMKAAVKSLARKALGIQRPPRINNNVIFVPRPQEGDLIDLALAYARRFPKDRVVWSELGPELLTAIVRIHATHEFTLQPPAYANPIPHWECPARLLAPNGTMPEGTAFLHCYNETWREAKIDKNAPFPKGSLMADLAERYL
jgi:hypothetical protein